MDAISLTRLSLGPNITINKLTKVIMEGDYCSMDGLAFLFSCSFLLNENSQFFSLLSLRSTRLTSVKFAAYYLKGVAS